MVSSSFFFKNDIARIGSSTLNASNSSSYVSLLYSRGNNRCRATFFLLTSAFDRICNNLFRFEWILNSACISFCLKDGVLSFRASSAHILTAFIIFTIATAYRLFYWGSRFKFNYLRLGLGLASLSSLCSREWLS